ncbi:MAG: alpha/beta hydrolase [Beijerinckiaceae bacterium]
MRAVNPDIVALMQAAAAAGVPALGSLPPEEARRSYLASRRALQPPFDPVSSCEDITIDGPGGALALRIFRGGAPGKPLPCLLFLHGGGWVLGNLESHEGMCRRIAMVAECCVIAVDYRLAPEHPFPAPLEDGAATLRWVATHAASLGIDASRIAVGGDSAGGNLAAVIALMGRDGSLPPCMYQLLFYPVTDVTMSGDSYERVTQGVPLTADSMRYFIDHYVPSKADRLDWRASPLRAASLEGAPPALVLTCGHDPLCTEGQLYAARLEREGVPVTVLHLSDQAHGILNMGKAVGAVSGVLDFAAATLREAWRNTSI